VTSGPAWSRFLEIPNGSHIYWWVDDAGNKVWVEAGYRKDRTFTDPSEFEHVLGNTSFGAPGGGAGTWQEGDWEYVDEDLNLGYAVGGAISTDVVRTDPDTNADLFPNWNKGDEEAHDLGRLENMDTLVLIVYDQNDRRNLDTDQLKIVDTPSSIAVQPAVLDYGCGAPCNIRVTITDPDENLDSGEVDYVPFFVIVNPGGFLPDDGTQTPSGSIVDPVTTFCSLMWYGGVDASGDPIGGFTGTAPNPYPVRWYDIYDAYTTTGGVTSRFIDYPNDWLDGTFGSSPAEVGRVMFYAAETGPDTGVFVHDFGILEELQAALGFDTFPRGTTIAFYYIDPNDFDDMVLTTARVTPDYYSEIYFVDSGGSLVDEPVKLGSHSGLYVRVYDSDANIEACCQDKVVVHLCDPHNEDDSEYWVIDEWLASTGIFISQGAMALLPVWDATGGYQLVWDNWSFEAFNEDTIYARPPVAERGGQFPTLGEPMRWKPWDVSFDMVKVYDTQVYDGETHHMRFLNGNYQPIDTVPMGGVLYLEVTDPDQNENPLRWDTIMTQWNKDKDPGDDTVSEDSEPIWWTAIGRIRTSPTPTSGRRRCRRR